MRYVRTLISLIVILGACATLDRWRSAGQSEAAAALTAAAMSLTCHETLPVRDEPAKDPSADRFGFGPWYINADRKVGRFVELAVISYRAVTTDPSTGI